MSLSGLAEVALWMNDKKAPPPPPPPPPPVQIQVHHLPIHHDPRRVSVVNHHPMHPPPQYHHHYNQFHYNPQMNYNVPNPYMQQMYQQQMYHNIQNNHSNYTGHNYTAGPPPMQHKPHAPKREMRIDTNYNVPIVAHSNEISPPCTTAPSTHTQKKTEWKDDEIAALRRGIEANGRDWVKISKLIPSRTREQVKNKGYAMILEEKTPHKATGHWKTFELLALRRGMEDFATDWHRIAEMIPTRSWSQIVRKGKHMMDSDKAGIEAAELQEDEGSSSGNSSGYEDEGAYEEYREEDEDVESAKRKVSGENEDEEGGGEEEEEDQRGERGFTNKRLKPNGELMMR